MMFKPLTKEQTKLLRKKFLCLLHCLSISEWNDLNCTPPTAPPPMPPLPGSTGTEGFPTIWKWQSSIVNHPHHPNNIHLITAKGKKEKKKMISQVRVVTHRYQREPGSLWIPRLIHWCLQPPQWLRTAWWLGQDCLYLGGSSKRQFYEGPPS